MCINTHMYTCKQEYMVAHTHALTHTQILVILNKSLTHTHKCYWVIFSRLQCELLETQMSICRSGHTHTERTGNLPASWSVIKKGTAICLRVLSLGLSPPRPTHCLVVFLLIAYQSQDCYVLLNSDLFSLTFCPAEDWESGRFPSLDSHSKCFAIML